METKYAVILIGGSIGNVKVSKRRDLNNIACHNLTYPLDEAKQKSRRLNKQLSPGEKSYYGLRYTYVKVIGGKYKV